MSNDSLRAPASERELLQRAAEWPQCPSFTDLTPERLREASIAEGIDFATALLYDRIRKSSEHGPFVSRICALQQCNLRRPMLTELTFAVAPGAFWREFPHIQADGRLLRSVAAELGCRTAMIPVPSTGPLRDNAQRILDWLREQPQSPIVLASLSKGGADVKLAIHQEPDAFRNVVAWINICGMLGGTPLAEYLLKTRWRQFLVRCLFLCRGLDFQLVRDLNPAPGGLLFEPMRLPEHMQFISIVGFPLQEHMHNRRSRMWRRVLDPLGPNDGGVLLHDVCQLPGMIYPVWGADHYLEPKQTDMRTLAAALLHYVDEELSVSNGTASQVPCESEVG